MEFAARLFFFLFNNFSLKELRLNTIAIAQNTKQ